MMGMAVTGHVMTISRNGQVSIPAPVRARWNARQVIMVDLGDRVVMRPVAERPVEELKGKYRGQGADADQVRRRERQQARERDSRR
jgi:bifunctional DNA-binding transcriptional regulator/antitoxin component of YhaV-PrlF toxin-antitoxin module